MKALRTGRLLAALCLSSAVHAGGAQAFVITGITLEDAQRWGLDYGLADGIQVGIDPGIASALGATTPQEEARVFGAIDAAFRAWESPALQFDLFVDSSVTIGKSSGFEIDLFALDGGDAVFQSQILFGLSVVDVDIYTDRTLSNGMRLNGQVIKGADIYLNMSLIALLAPQLPDEATRIAALTRLLIHEIGHTIGMRHTGESNNWDTDLDPTNAMVFDPSDPFGNLIISPNEPTDPIMLVRPCGSNLITCAPLFYTALTPDDIGGRDSLYPVALPEPALAASLALGGLILGLRRSVRDRLEVRVAK